MLAHISEQKNNVLGSTEQKKKTAVKSGVQSALVPIQKYNACLYWLVHAHEAVRWMVPIVGDIIKVDLKVWELTCIDITVKPPSYCVNWSSNKWPESNGQGKKSDVKNITNPGKKEKKQNENHENHDQFSLDVRISTSEHQCLPFEERNASSMK
jgi:hypothetical protein